MPLLRFLFPAGSGEDYDRFLAAAVRAIEAAPVSGEVSADTVYFGGGTPVLLGARRLNRLLSAVQKRFGAAQREITVEANPCAVGPEMLEELRAGGFTRISFGVQSLFEPTLQTLGRKHDAARADRGAPRGGAGGLCPHFGRSDAGGSGTDGGGDRALGRSAGCGAD